VLRVEQHKRLPVEPGQRDHRPEKPACRKIEGHDMALPTQYRESSGPNLNPRGRLNSSDGSGRNTRTSSPVAASYSRTPVTASGAPKGNSLATTMCPFGATVRSSGLSSGSVTKRRGRTARSRSNTTIVLSPSPEEPTPDARYTRPSDAKANPRGNGTMPSGRSVSRSPPTVAHMGQYRPCAPHADVVATVGPERATARIKPGYRTGIMHDVSALIANTRSSPLLS
jgi:hypothetical protein